MKTRDELPINVQRIAATQHDVVTYAQLEGVSRATIRANVRGHRWQHVGRGVFVLHNGPLTYAQRTWVALLCSPAGAVVSGPTAARLDGLALGHLTVAGAEDVHITLPANIHTRPTLLARVHWSTQLSEADVQATRIPIRTRLPRSVVDTAAWQPNERIARAVILTAVQQGLVSPTQLLEALGRRANCRHRGIIAESIADAAGGIASVPEREFNEILRAHGFPPPSRQVIRRRPGGRYYLDVAWDEYGIAVEIEGAHHFDAEQRERDLDRLNDLVIGNDRVLLFSSYAVRRRQERVADTLRRAFAASNGPLRQAATA